MHLTTQPAQLVGGILVFSTPKLLRLQSLRVPSPGVNESCTDFEIPGQFTDWSAMICEFDDLGFEFAIRPGVV